MKNGNGKDMTASGAPWQIAARLEDDALTPVIERGSQVVIDCSDRTLVDGGIYAIREGDQLKIWLFHEGFAGLGTVISGRKVGTLSSVAGTFRCRGPIQLDKLLVVGRVLDMPQGGYAAGSMAALRAERIALVNALEDARASLRRISGTTPAVDFNDPNGAVTSISKVTRRYEEAMQDEDFSRRFALEQKMDAIGSRLMHIEERIADTEVDDVDGAYTKLQVLWDLHYAPFPNLQGDLGARFISSALRALGKTGRVYAPREEEPVVMQAQGGTRPIQLVTSPRNR
ncbi:MAG: hypothetical protein H6851_17315 [Geminicoccaceae bacterium]|nr:hypothetical protein [Geminicoccaceae bacterium]MCB9945364.1 hypothetical protein [Geminicoccaceae bacterium]